MPEVTQDAVPVGEAENTAPPVPDFSAGSQDASSAGPGFDVDALEARIAETLDAKLSKIDDLIDARFKSGKDKRLSKVDEIYEYVKKSGGDPDKVMSELREREAEDKFDKKFAQLEARLASVGVGGTTPKDAVQDATTEMLNKFQSELGVTLSDEEVDALSKSKRYSEPADWYVELSKAATKKAKGESITEAAAITPPGISPQQEDIGSVAQELSELNKGQHGSITDPKVQERRRELTAILEKEAPITEGIARDIMLNA